MAHCLVRNLLSPHVMSAPRPVFQNQTRFSTRRTTQRQFLLRPDKETNNAFVYCLAEAAQRCGVQVVLAQMMSNHEHSSTHDPDGRDVEFREHFHKMFAKCQNARLGRWENLWSSEEPCVVDLMTVDDLLEKLVYIATNPVKDGLVERVHQWPGPNFVKALLTGEPMKAHRPRHFFAKNGTMPPAVELRLELPDYIDDKPAFLAALERRILAVEEECIRERAKTGRGVVGRRKILRAYWYDSPSTREPRRVLRPRVAARDKWIRIARLQRDKEWRLEYRAARAKWLAGVSVEFPYGTYWLRRFANVLVSPPGSTRS